MFNTLNPKFDCPIEFVAEKIAISVISAFNLKNLFRKNAKTQRRVIKYFINVQYL